MAKEVPQWMGRPIAHPDDAKHLEHKAALHEFGSKIPKSEAEDRAYKEYTVDKRLDAAAHHLTGMKIAHAAGDMETAKKHGALYDQHVKALGLASDGAVPAEVVERAKTLDKKNLFGFKPHQGDAFATPPTK